MSYRLTPYAGQLVVNAAGSGKAAKVTFGRRGDRAPMTFNLSIMASDPGRCQALWDYYGGPNLFVEPVPEKKSAKAAE